MIENVTITKKYLEEQEHCLWEGYKCCNLLGLELKEDTWVMGDFIGCDFSATHIQDTTLHDAMFTNCNFYLNIWERIDFNNCVFTHCVFDKTSFLQGLNSIKGAQFNNCSFLGATGICVTTCGNTKAQQVRSIEPGEKTHEVTKEGVTDKPTLPEPEDYDVYDLYPHYAMGGYEHYGEIQSNVHVNDAALQCNSLEIYNDLIDY
jgi:hypothetical protein